MSPCPPCLLRELRGKKMIHLFPFAVYHLASANRAAWSLLGTTHSAADGSTASCTARTLLSTADSSAANRAAGTLLSTTQRPAADGSTANRPARTLLRAADGSTTAAKVPTATAESSATLHLLRSGAIGRNCYHSRRKHIQKRLLDKRRGRIFELFTHHHDLPL